MEQVLDILIILSASIIVVVLSRHLKLSPVLGYLITGMVIGKHGYHILLNQENAVAIGEFGVVFLLFTIGLELTIDRVLKMRTYVFGFGGAQLLLTTAALTFIIFHHFKFSLPLALVVAAAFSLSSTAVVLQVLAESGRQSTQVGRLSLAVLLMQDLAVVPLLAALPLIAQPQSQLLQAVGIVSLKALGTVIGIIIIGRLLLRPLFSVVSTADSEEIYMPTTFLIALGSAVLTKALGLSEVMGSFVAGLLIAETEYRNKVENSIMPFKSLLLGLFFMTVGMDLNIEFILKNWKGLLIASGVLLSTKGIIVFGLCKLFRMQWGAATHSGLLLAQGGEFAFVLLGIAFKQKILPQDTTQFLMMMVAISMAVTPILSGLGAMIEDIVDTEQQLDGNHEFRGVGDLDQHVIIAGFGRVGRVVALMLSKANVSYVAVDSNAALVKKGRNQGFPIYHGDPSDTDALKAVGAKRARSIILTMDDKLSIRKAVKASAQEYRHLCIIARAEDYRHGAGLRKLGATITVASTIETGVQIGTELLDQLGFPEKDIVAMKDRMRLEHYSLLEEVELFQGVMASRFYGSAKDKAEIGPKNHIT